MKNIKEKVLYILKRHPETRDDDRVLYQYYLIYTAGKEFKNKLIPINIITQAPNMDTLGRARRHIQNVDLLYPPTPYATGKRAKQTEKIMELTK